MANKLTIFDVASRSMAAQQVRLNTIASNLANAASVSGNPDTVFRPIKPVFEAQYHDVMEKTGIATVDVTAISQSSLPPEKRYAPNHPSADREGYVYAPPIDPNAEMVDMLESSRQYQNNIEVLSTAKALLIKTLNVGK